MGPLLLPSSPQHCNGRERERGRSANRARSDRAGCCNGPCNTFPFPEPPRMGPSGRGGTPCRSPRSQALASGHVPARNGRWADSLPSLAPPPIESRIGPSDGFRAPRTPMSASSPVATATAPPPRGRRRVGEGSRGGRTFGICGVCGRPTERVSNGRAFRRTCSDDCRKAAGHPASVAEVVERRRREAALAKVSADAPAKPSPPMPRGPVLAVPSCWCHGRPRPPWASGNRWQEGEVVHLIDD